MSETTNTPELGFKALGLTPKLLSVLDKVGFVVPTPIQEQAIPVALSGADLLGIAQTGTGKTLAFGLPMIERLRDAEGIGLILAPTRELALQIDETLQSVGRTLGIRTAVLIGGAPMGKQIAQLRRDPHIIVATPGRLKDHLFQRTCSLRYVSIAVLDEADRMLDMGFWPVIRDILAQVPSDRQTMLFSATMPAEIADLAKSTMKDPVRIEIARAGTAAELVSQELYVSSFEDKPDLLGRLLNDEKGTVLVFSRTRHGARKVAKAIRTLGHTAAELHADRTLAQRREALDGFKSGKYRVLVATDIAARGIDVKQISLVINYDLPDNPEDYIHRIGRTGRAGETGHAITIATPDQNRDVRDIEKLLRKELPLSPNSALPFERSNFVLRPKGRAPHGRPQGRPQQGPGRPPFRGGDRRGPKSAQPTHGR
jgi:ATP-dependent RNA helicase RhlE